MVTATADDIRVYEVEGEYDRKTWGLEIRVLPPHRRNIVLGNGRTTCVSFPYTVCFAGVRRPQPSYSLVGLGFAKTSDLTFDTPVWIPPLPHFNGFSPTCHPCASFGRDQFECDFNGMFGSPFEMDVFDSANQNSLKINFGSLREWGKLDLDQVMKKFNVGQFKLLDMLAGYSIIKFKRMKELAPMPSRAGLVL